jgi:hypothetical protein
MAVRGLSMAERHRYILKDDPAHPDNISAEVEKRLAAIGGNKIGEQERMAVEIAVRNEAGEPTVFILGNLAHSDKIFLSDLLGNIEQTREGNMRMKNQNTLRMYECVKRALLGWENYLDENGNQIPFEIVPGVSETGQPRKVVSEKSLNMLHIDVVRELAGEILRINGVTSELEKKLEGLLRQPSDPPSLDGLVKAVTSGSKENEDAA